MIKSKDVNLQHGENKLSTVVRVYRWLSEVSPYLLVPLPHVPKMKIDKALQNIMGIGDPRFLF